MSFTNFRRCLVSVAIVAATAGVPLHADSARLQDPLKACLDNAATTLAMVECEVAALTAAEKVLKATLTHVRQALQPDQQTQLDAAQRQWLIFRKADCEVHYSKMGGSIMTVDYTGCLAARTNERIRDLHDFLPETH